MLKCIKRCYNVYSLPFKIKRDEASKIFSQKTFFEKQTINNGLILYNNDRIIETYIPFHSSDIKNLSSSFIGQYGINRIEVYTIFINGKISTQSRIVTDWYHCRGNLCKHDYPFGTLETQIYADFKYPRYYIEKCLRMNDVIHISPHIKSDINIDMHNMNVSFGLEKIITGINELEKDRVKEYIRNKYNADDSSVDKIDVHLEDADIELYSYFVPAYIYIFTHNNKEYYKVLNGYNGMLSGTKIYSHIKFIVSGFISFSSLTLLVLSFNPYFRLTTFFISRILMVGSIGGILGGLFASNYHQYKIKKFTIENKKMEEYNSFTIESDEDIIRRNTVFMLNGGKASIMKFPIDQCNILGLDPNNITNDILKHAYYSKLKVWHPDVYKKDKELAKLMTIKVVDAHKVIHDILNN